MSKEYIIFDKNFHSGRIMMFRQDSFCNSGKKVLENEADAIAVEDAQLSRAEDGGEEDSEGVDALLNSADDQISSTAKSPSCQTKVTEGLKRLREMVDGGEFMDAAEGIEDAIRCVKRLHMELLAKFQKM